MQRETQIEQIEIIVKEELQAYQVQQDKERSQYQERIKQLEDQLTLQGMREQTNKEVEGNEHFQLLLDQKLLEQQSRFNEEKSKMIQDYESQILQKESVKDSENDWRERIIRSEQQRQYELEEAREQLNQLKRSQINSQEIEFNAERNVYENRIIQLNQQIFELQEVYDNDFREMRRTIEGLRQQNSQLNEELVNIQNDRHQLLKSNEHLSILIDEMRNNQTGYHAEKIRDEREGVSSAEQLKMKHRSALKTDPVYTGSTERSPHGVRTLYNDKTITPSLFTPQRLQQYREQMSGRRYPEYQEIETVQDIQQLDDVINKYKSALNNIQHLENRVEQSFYDQLLDKLEEVEIVIE